MRQRQSGWSGTALVRNRMPGGVGGRRGQPRLLPDRPAGRTHLKVKVLSRALMTGTVS
jgi:hypothetical protein